MDKKGEYFTSRGLGGANIITNSLTQLDSELSKIKKIDDCFYTALARGLLGAAKAELEQVRVQ